MVKASMTFQLVAIRSIEGGNRSTVARYWQTL